MATIYPTRDQTGFTNAFVATFEPLANGDVTEPAATASYTDKSVQVHGTFGVGGALMVEGSNDGVNWATLSDEQGNPLVFTAAGLKMPSQATAFIRASASGDGTTSLTAVFFFKE